MDSNRVQVEEQLKAVQIKLVLMLILNVPASSVMGLCLFAKFGVHFEYSRPLLSDASIVNTILLVAIPLAVFCSFRVSKLSKKFEELKLKPSI